MEIINSEKIIITEKVDYDFNWCWGIELSQMKKDIEELEKLGVTHINIEPYIEYDCSSVKIDATFEREETDEELAERLQQIKTKEEKRKEADLKLLNELKKKYNM